VRLLLLLFVGVPLVELTLLLVLGGLTSWWVSLLLVIVSGVVGSILARRQGLKVFGRIRSEMQLGRMPTDSVLDAGMIFFAGALLLTPGILTDILGTSLLIPICRRFYRARVAAWFRRRFADQLYPLHREEPPFSDIVDSHAINHQEEDAT